MALGEEEREKSRPMDRTAVLHELFEKSNPYIEGCENFVALRLLRAHPFSRAFVIVTSNAEAAVRAAHSRIKAALRAIDECSPAMADLETALLMQEAELLSASNTIKELRTSIEEAQTQLEKKKNGAWRALLFSKERKEKEENKKGREKKRSPSSVKLSLQFLQHLDSALEILEGNVGRCRLRLALCKEELALYKQEMFIFGRAGVLSCSHLEENREENRGGFCSDEQRKTDDNNAKVALLSQRKEEKPHSSAIRMVSAMDRVIKEATRTVTAAPLPHKMQLWPLMAGDRGEMNLSRSSLADAMTPHYVYTAEEEKRLTEANLMLQDQQKQASVEDAKAVEASVRELSQLTSLMNEHVMQQNEQFSILLKNTEAAQNNMHKGVAEVQKTLSGFWNSTRQLILCLWISIFVLLVANWIIR